MEDFVMSKKLQGFIINALIVMGVMMLVNRVDFLRKLIIGS